MPDRRWHRQQHPVLFPHQCDFLGHTFFSINYSPFGVSLTSGKLLKNSDLYSYWALFLNISKQIPNMKVSALSAIEIINREQRKSQPAMQITNSRKTSSGVYQPSNPIHAINVEITADRFKRFLLSDINCVFLNQTTPNRQSITKDHRYNNRQRKKISHY